MTRRRFWIPHPGHLEGLQQLLAGLEDVLDEVEAVYTGSSPSHVGTGRPNLNEPERENLEEQVETAHSHGVMFDVVVNTTCPLGGKPTRRVLDGFQGYLERLEKMGVDGVIVADPWLLRVASDVFDRVVVSCLAFVNSPEKAEFFSDHASAVTLDTNVNRNLDVIKAISKVINVKLIVNEGCLKDCPFRPFHFNLFSHMYGPDRTTLYDDYYYRRCMLERVKNPELIIKSPWVRPEDLHWYDKLVSGFKIGGRSYEIGWIIRAVRAYVRGEYRGNLLDILDCPRELRDHFYVDNRGLEGAMEHWVKRCTGLCHECGFCKDLARKVVRVIEPAGASPG